MDFLSERFRIELASEQDLDLLRALFEKMYDHFYNSNGITVLAEGGFERWSANYNRSKTVSRTIYIAYENDLPVAFIEGQIRISPATSHPEKIGHVAHLFVDSDFRQQGLASLLYAKLLGWFKEKKVGSETLDVVNSNALGEVFWSTKGFRPTFLSYTKSGRPTEV